MSTSPLSRSAWDVVNRLDEDDLSRRFQAAEPFPWICIDDFLVPDFARAVAAAYPGFGEAQELGRTFRAVNEQLKVQITDPVRFPDPVRQLHEALAAPEFVEALGRVTGISGLLADPELVGGGMHVMGGGGRLDVHVDFNRIPERNLFRRLNILVFLNDTWEEAWGGALELWDRDVRERAAAFAPQVNRCVVFETSEISYHGVTPIRCPEDRVRKSFAAYYYTADPPESYRGVDHSTIFRARPEERVRGALLMPVERISRKVIPALRRFKWRLQGRRDPGDR